MKMLRCFLPGKNRGIEALEELLNTQSASLSGFLKWPGKNVRIGEMVRFAMLQPWKRGIRQYDPFLKTLQEVEKRFK